MLRFLKAVRVLFWWAMFTSIASMLVFVAVLRHNTIPAWDEIAADTNISQQLSGKAASAVAKSRQSAVMVRSVGLNIFVGVSTMSGTYFTAKDKNYVITVEHGIQGPCWLVTVVHDNKLYSCREMIAVDKGNDYAIFEVEQIDNIRPLNIPKDLPKGTQWKRSYSLLNKIIYTGYPNVVGPLTLRGDVVGYTQYEQIYVFSHAYGGASGSGVFSDDGKYIGYVVAVDVGQTELGLDVLENIVIVNPSFNVDWRIVLD